MKKPLIAVTLGDPAGIGPEIVVKTVADHGTFEKADCIVIGAVCLEVRLRQVQKKFAHLLG